MDLVSIVIPCYNPGEWVKDAIDSARTQTYSHVEIVVVNDGTSEPESLVHLRTASAHADVCVEQQNLGLPAARNAGFRAAHGKWVLPLDADDRIAPDYVAECVSARRQFSEAAFIYTDCKVFGEQKYTEELPEYNLYNLLDRNTLTYAALISKEDWEHAGGYDESMRLGYEDWEFWLRMGALGRFGRRVPRPLFHYRKRGRSLFSVALEHHDSILAYIRSRHPELYDDENKARIKKLWAPSVCVLGRRSPISQTIQDIYFSEEPDPSGAFQRAAAPALIMPGANGIDPQSAELAALAVWAGHQSLRLDGGSTALSRRFADRQADLSRQVPAESPAAATRAVPAGNSHWRTFHRHLVNADVLSWKSWLQHPLRSVLRLVPLRLKEQLNQAVGRPVFDLSFYLRFQPQSLLFGTSTAQPIRYCPDSAGGRSRVALITPHLGIGGAESVLLEVASALPPSRFEVLLLATQSTDNRWAARWRDRVAHVYDLARVVPPEKMVAAIHSIVTNWKCDAVLVQNSLSGYAALPHLKRERPQIELMDIVHATGDKWDLVSATAEVAPQFDVRVAVSEAVRARLLASGTPAEKVRVVHNGVDIERFHPSSAEVPHERHRILFAGRLDPVKRPHMLVDIAAELALLRKNLDFTFVVAGDGPEAGSQRDRVHRRRLSGVFEFLGHVEEMAPLIAGADVVVLPSRSEGVPLIVLEALACGTPVVASEVGGIPEVLDSSCGMLIGTDGHEAQAFAAAIDQLLQRPDLRKKMGEAGRARVAAEYDQGRAREAYARLFAGECR